MRISADLLFSNAFSESVEQCIASDDVFSRVINNTGGILYQLIYGNEFGSGTYIFGNNGITKLFGKTYLEFTEAHYKKIIMAVIPENDDMPGDQVEIRRKFISGEIEEWRGEVLIETTSGEKKWIRDTFIPVKEDRTGRVIGVTGIIFDISEQKNICLELEKAREMANESERLKVAFLNNLSHEIRTPLNAIVGFTTLLNQPGNTIDTKQDYVDIITHSSDHLLEIVDDIIDISRIEAKIVRLAIKETNLSEMMLRVYERFIPLAKEKNISLSFKLPEESDIIIKTDEFKIFQSLSNLVSNALKFTKEGKVEFGLFRKEGKHQFYVTDTGIGIGKEHYLRIFNPFYQAESGRTQRYDGNGLGLSIAKAYIELLSGEIWFSSIPGTGTEFFFNIPDIY